MGLLIFISLLLLRNNYSHTMALKQGYVGIYFNYDTLNIKIKSLFHYI